MKPLRDIYVENTRNALLDAGRSLFLSRDYNDVSTEEIAQAAGLTRGALYHHFQGKRELFEAVLCEIEDDVAHSISAAMGTRTDPEQRALDGMRTYLDHCADEEFRHLVLQQAVIALGWHRVIEIDTRYIGSILMQEVREAIDSGRLKPHAPELIASTFYGALTNLSLAIGTADDPGAARDSAMDLLADLLSGLRPETV